MSSPPFVLVVPLVARLPAPLAYGAAVLHGDLYYRWNKRRRREIARCLGLVFGNLSPKERQPIVRDYFRLRSCEAVDSMRMAGSGRALRRLVEVRGIRYLDEALAQGKGVVLCGAHFGSHNNCFDLLGTMGYRINWIARWSFRDDDGLNPLGKLFYRIGLSRPVTPHSSTIERKPENPAVAIEAMRALRKNEVVGVMVDHAVYPFDKARPVSVKFLNGTASLLPGAITLAQFTGAPVLMMLMRRSGDWRHQVIDISPPMPVQGDPVAAFKRCLSFVEDAILRMPAHWKSWRIGRMIQLGLLAGDSAPFPSKRRRNPHSKRT